MKDSQHSAHFADVSVVVPTFNRETTICRAIDSILGQSIPPKEVIVVDDGSADNTESVVSANYAGRVIYHKQPNSGVAAARNKGISLASTSLIAFLDSDDYWTPQKIEKQLPCMSQNDVVLSNTNWRWEDEPSGNEFDAVGMILDSAIELPEWPLAHLCRDRGHRTLIQTCICRREALERLGGFDESFRITEDNDLFFRIAELGRLAILRDVLLVRTKDEGEKNLTDSKSEAWQAENLDNMLKIVRRTVQTTSGYPREERDKINSRLASLLLSRATLAARTGDVGLSRNLCRRATRVAHFPSKTYLLSSFGMAAPQLLKLRT